MIGSTLYFANPTSLSIENNQLKIEVKNKNILRKIPTEDIACLIFDNPQISITTYATNFLLAHKAIIVYCDEKHLPSGLLLPFYGHHLPNARARKQLELTKKLQGKLWKYTVQRKIENQAIHLGFVQKNNRPLKRWQKEVLTQDSSNVEGKAARYYWGKLFEELGNFKRERYGLPPNNLLNFGYTILRSMTCRAIISAGLLPVLGIHHHNQYNPFCLADDLMEPYRPFVDQLVYKIIQKDGEIPTVLEKSHKSILLSINYMDISMNKKMMPLMLALERTCYSLVEVFENKRTKICYPTIIHQD